jgi:Tol biopolymer transport system component
MTPNNDLLDHAIELFRPPDGSFERLTRRRDQRERTRRVSAALLAIVLSLLSITGLIRAFSSSEPATEPTPTPVDRGIFSQVGGWIAYADKLGTSGIWAVDPEAPGDPKDQILLSPGTGEPVAWSSDGSRLLILRRTPDHAAGHFRTDLFVLNADGTETRLTSGDTYITGGSFSPDGSKVVYAAQLWSDEPARIYVVDTSGGTPQVLLNAIDDPKGSLHLWLPTFSPDGSRIAYFDGVGEISRSLRVMNADGSGTRVLHDGLVEHQGGMHFLVWSPDGSQLLFDGARGIYRVGADGSRLTLVIPDEYPFHHEEFGRHAVWSPDFSRVAYIRANGLVIADADGTHVQEFGYAGSGPWNPLSEASSDIAPPAPSDIAPAASAGATFDTRLLWGAVLLALGATFVVIRRRKRQAAEP